MEDLLSLSNKHNLPRQLALESIRINEWVSISMLRKARFILMALRQGRWDVNVHRLVELSTEVVFLIYWH